MERVKLNRKKKALQPHGRSISLPSRLHPTSLRVEEDLNTLKALEEPSPSSSSWVQARLVGLANLYISVDELIRSPSTWQALHHYDHRRLVEEALEDSVGFLNICGTARELVSSLKDQVRDLQSALRRRPGGGSSSSIERYVSAYIRSRKNAKKQIARCLRELKQMESKTCHFVPLLDIELHFAGVFRVLREVVSITVSVFRSLFLLLSVPLMKSKTTSKWSLISKLIARGANPSKRSDTEVLNEVASVDASLHFLNCSNGKENLQAIQGRLKLLDSGIPSLETALDKLFRCLVQDRVSLLNILSQ